MVSTARKNTLCLFLCCLLITSTPAYSATYEFSLGGFSQPGASLIGTFEAIDLNSNGFIRLAEAGELTSFNMAYSNSFDRIAFDLVGLTDFEFNPNPIFPDGLVLAFEANPSLTSGIAFLFSTNIRSHFIIAASVGDESLELPVITEISSVPVPAAIWLFGTCLLGLIGFSMRRKSA